MWHSIGRMLMQSGCTTGEQSQQAFACGPTLVQWSRNNVLSIATHHHLLRERYRNSASFVTALCVTHSELEELPTVPLLPETLLRVVLPAHLQKHVDALEADREHGAAELAEQVLQVCKLCCVCPILHTRASQQVHTCSNHTVRNLADAGHDVSSWKHVHHQRYPHANHRHSKQLHSTQSSLHHQQHSWRCGATLHTASLLAAQAWQHWVMLLVK